MKVCEDFPSKCEWTIPSSKIGSLSAILSGRAEMVPITLLLRNFCPLFVTVAESGSRLLGEIDSLTHRLSLAASVILECKCRSRPMSVADSIRIPSQLTLEEAMAAMNC